jgi:hypothetical protein
MSVKVKRSPRSSNAPCGARARPSLPTCI